MVGGDTISNYDPETGGGQEQTDARIDAADQIVAGILAAMIASAAALVAAGTGAMLLGSVAPPETPISVPWLTLVAVALVATVLRSVAGVLPALSATTIIPVQEGLVEQ